MANGIIDNNLSHVYRYINLSPLTSPRGEDIYLMEAEERAALKCYRSMMVKADIAYCPNRLTFAHLPRSLELYIASEAMIKNFDMSK